MYRLTRLQNGLTVATAEMPHMASISLGVWVGVGGRHETAGLNGASHFIEHMLFKGTATRSAREISQAVEGIGGNSNAFTGEENTCFYAKARHDRLPDLLDVLMDMFCNSRFERTEIDKERDVIKEELAMVLDEPDQRVQELLNETIWPDHPLGRPLTGTEKSLDGLGRAALLKYLRAHYVAGNTLIVGAGRLGHGQLLKAVAPYARRLGQGRRPAFLPANGAQTAPTFKLHTRDTAQTQIALGFRACSRHDDRRFALRLLNVMLGENTSSRLFQVIREDHGLAYSIHSSTALLDDTGLLAVSAGLDTGKLPQSLRLIMRELKNFTEQPPGGAELRRARDYRIGQLDLSLENTENQMMWIGEQLLGYGKVFSPAEVKQKLAEVTAGQIRAVARECFRPERMSLAVVSPLKSGETLKKLLRF
ncbi:MAG: insulinase family protein [Pedosphaera sp.]|nr:insulinase family protein [Pedosphaera sp.]